MTNIELTDEQYANCRRHGGVANIINCWECLAETQEDNENAGREDDQDD
jgi:hypothetical protein